MDTLSGMYLRKPLWLTPRISRNLVAEAKASDGIVLEGHIPQVLVELVACKKHLGKFRIRGALTTGEKCIFLAVDLDGEGEGATYWEWVVIWRACFAPDATVPVTYDRYDPGILSSWVPDSFSEFDGDEWFYKSPLSSNAANSLSRAEDSRSMGTS